MFSEFKINICFCVDNNILHFLPIVINSILLKNSKYSLTIHIVFDNSISPEYINKLFTEEHLFSSLEFKFYKVDWNKSYIGLKHITKTTMSRLYIPDLILDTDLVIYLDIDIIVNCDLRDIIDKHDISKSGIAMKDSLRINHFRYLGNRNRQSANCGVMLLDCNILRKNNFVKTCLDLCDKYPNYHDQEIINMYCNGNHCRLNKNYNIFHNQDSHLVDEYPEDFIYHFA